MSIGFRPFMLLLVTLLQLAGGGQLSGPTTADQRCSTGESCSDSHAGWSRALCGCVSSRACGEVSGVGVANTIQHRTISKRLRRTRILCAPGLCVCFPGCEGEA